MMIIFQLVYCNFSVCKSAMPPPTSLEVPRGSYCGGGLGGGPLEERSVVSGEGQSHLSYFAGAFLLCSISVDQTIQQVSSSSYC